jgi:Bacteriophage replication protein O
MTIGTVYFSVIGIKYLMGDDNMPWAGTYKRTVEVYKVLLKEMILSNEANIDLKIKEFLIRSEIQKRDFTKRHLNILSLIVTLSFNFGKESAILQITDFALTGLSVKKVKSEVDQLIEMGVITWNVDFNEFSISEPTSWKVPYHKHYDDKRSQELFFLNLKHAGVDVNPILEKIKKLNL